MDKEWKKRQKRKKLMKWLMMFGAIYSGDYQMIRKYVD